MSDVPVSLQLNQLSPFSPSPTLSDQSFRDFSNNLLKSPRSVDTFRHFEYERQDTFSDIEIQNANSKKYFIIEEPIERLKPPRKELHSARSERNERYEKNSNNKSELIYNTKTSHKPKELHIEESSFDFQEERNTRVIHSSNSSPNEFSNFQWDKEENIYVKENELFYNSPTNRQPSLTNEIKYIEDIASDISSARSITVDYGSDRKSIGSSKISGVSKIVPPLDNFDNSISHDPGMALHSSGVHLSEKAKSILRQWELEKDKFFVSTLRKHSSKIYQLKSQINHQKEKWSDRLTVLNRWLEWNKMTIIGGGSGSRSYFSESSSIAHSPTLSLRELEELINIWILESDLSRDIRSQTNILNIDEKLQFLQTRGYSKKELIPSSLLNPSEDKKETLVLEKKSFEYNVDIMLKEVFNDLLETDRIVIEKMENIEKNILTPPEISNTDQSSTIKYLEKEIQTLPQTFNHEPAEDEDLQSNDYPPSQHASKINEIEEDDEIQSQLSDLIQSRPSSSLIRTETIQEYKEYKSPSISRSSSRIDQEISSSRIKISDLKNTIEAQSDEIDSLRYDFQKIKEENEEKQKEIEKLKDDLLKKISDNLKLERSLQKIKKELDATRILRHKNSQLEQELKFSEYKIQREKNKAEDEARALKLQQEQFNQRLKEEESIQQSLRQRISDFENNLNITSSTINSETNKIVLQLEEVVSQIETNNVLKIQHGRRSRPPTRTGGKFVSPIRLQPMQTDDTNTLETSISLNDFVDTPKLANLLKSTMKQVTDINLHLNTVMKELEYYRRISYQQNDNDSNPLIHYNQSGVDETSKLQLKASNLNLSSGQTQISTISYNPKLQISSGTPIDFNSDLNVISEHSKELTPRKNTTIDPSKQQNQLQDSILFAEESNPLRPNRRFSLRKNGTPVFPQRTSTQEGPNKRVSLPTLLPSLDSLQGVGFSRVDTKSSTPIAKLSKRLSEGSLHVVVPHISQGIQQQEKINVVKHQNLQSYLRSES